MRTIPSNTLVQISEQYGNEPVNIVAIEWDGNVHWYADRDVESIPGKIANISDMETTINVSGSSDSEEISISLDDTDGSIKTFMDTNDVHKVDAWVYQYFYGMHLDDKFLLFKGTVNSPIVWNEGTRQVSFNIVSRLEDDDVGFSAEEGQFRSVADELIGKPWPLVFGSVTGVRALRLTRVGAAITGQAISLPDITLNGHALAIRVNANYQQNQQDAMNSLVTSFGSAAGASDTEDEVNYWLALRDKSIQAADNARINAINFRNRQLVIIADYNTQVAAGSSTGVNIIDSGSPIPTGAIEVKIGGARFIGDNNGSRITFESHDISWYVSAGREWIRVNTYGTVPRELTDEPLNLPRATGEQILASSVTYGYSGDRFVVHNTFKQIKLDGNVTGSSLGYFHVSAGTSIEVLTAEPQKYIVSITPGIIRRVSAYYNNNGLRVLRVVPTEYYTETHERYGSVIATGITTTDALSKLGNWEDDIFVDFFSTVGPNTVDIMEYLIDNYSGLTYDTTSFDAVKEKLENYPSHFTLHVRKNILTLLKEMAWQCRCSIRLVNDVFYLTYLSESPTTVDSIETTDILVDSLELGYTATEDLTTKMVCTWESTGSQKEKHRIILKNNVSKYGVQENDYDFYIYNYLDAVIKSATFWLIRYSNTWRKATFTTPITKLNIETLDAISLDISFISSNAIKALVESAIYDSSNYGINFNCWLPVLAGTDTEYVFAFPASADSTEIFQADVEDPQSITVGEPIINYNRAYNDPYSLRSTKGDRRFSTLGSRFPSDFVDKRPSLTQSPTVPPFSVLPTQGVATPDYTQIETLSSTFEADAAGIVVIDIHNTLITDSITGLSAPLNTFFDRIADVDGTDTLIVSATHSVVGDDDDTNEQIAQFHYRYDDDDTVWGAGTAFLK